MPSHGAVPVFGRAPPSARVAWRPQGACPFLDPAISNEALKLCTCLSNQHQDYDMDVYFSTFIYIYIYLLYNMNIIHTYIPITIKGLDNQVDIPDWSELGGPFRFRNMFRLVLSTPLHSMWRRWNHHPKELRVRSDQWYPVIIWKQPSSVSNLQISQGLLQEPHLMSQPTRQSSRFRMKRGKRRDRPFLGSTKPRAAMCLGEMVMSSGFRWGWYGWIMGGWGWVWWNNYPLVI